MEKPKLIERITRKDIAQWIDMAVDLVRKQESRLGLKACRLPVKIGREVIYNGTKARAALRERGLIE